MNSGFTKTKLNNKPLWLAVGLAVLVLIVLLLVKDKDDQAARPLSGGDVLHAISQVSRSLSKEMEKSVVRVEVQRNGDPQSDDLSGLLGNRPLAAFGQGSGIVVSTDGLILTNHHVVAGATAIDISGDGVKCAAELVGVDVLTDLALLRASQQLGSPVQWGDSDQLAVGDFVWAIGNPFGLQRSVTFGIVSAMQQDEIQDNQFQNFFQTDAAVNPGNSGGPVVTGDGKVVGINTAIAGEAYRGISFAIPSNTARDVMKQLISSGRVRRGWLGANLADLSHPKSIQLAMPNASGALVQSLSESHASPARAADIRVDDVIVGWNDTDVLSAVHLGQLIAQTDLGTVARVRIWRNGETQTKEVTILERP